MLVVALFRCFLRVLFMKHKTHVHTGRKRTSSRVNVSLVGAKLKIISRARVNKKYSSAGVRLALRFRTQALAQRHSSNQDMA